MNTQFSDQYTLVRHLSEQQFQADTARSSPVQAGSSLPPSTLSSSDTGPSLSDPPLPDPLPVEQIDALKSRVAQPEELTGFADDEGDGGTQARRNQKKDFLLGGKCKFLSAEQKKARQELAMRIKQVMKTLTNRGQDPESSEDAAQASLPDLPDHHQQRPKFAEDAELINRTVELVLIDHRIDEQTGNFLCGNVHFNKADLCQLATLAFRNQKRQYLTQLNISMKKDKRKRRKIRRHLRQRQTKKERERQVGAYKRKYGGDLPAEIFQSDCMTELLSELDSTDIPNPSSDEGESDEDEEDDELKKREEVVQMARTIRFGQMITVAGLTQRAQKVQKWEERKPAFGSAKLTEIYRQLDELTTNEIRVAGLTQRAQRVQMWEQRKPAFRSAKLTEVYKRLDQLKNETRANSHHRTRRVFIGNTSSKIPKCKKVVWPFMVDTAWLSDDEDHKKSCWTKLQRSDPADLDLGFVSDVDVD